jgi:hypothetical protein
MKENPDDLMAEKSLWQIWRMSLRLRRNRFNLCAIIVVMSALIPVAFMTNQSPREISEMVRKWAEVGLGFAASILGFLVAGFTIFATLTRPKLLAAMARVKEDRSGLSYLKYNFGAFFETFGWYVGFSVMCVFILVFGASGGAIQQVANAFGGTVRAIVARTGMVLMGASFFWILLELKSFIYNIYHVMMTSISWMIEFDPELSQPEPEPRHDTANL